MSRDECLFLLKQLFEVFVSQATKKEKKGLTGKLQLCNSLKRIKEYNDIPSSLCNVTIPHYKGYSLKIT